VLSPLPADPQKVEFEAEDGQKLMGTYYPAAVNPAPLVVLMHWAPGDENDWVAIAAWLQNRGLEIAPDGQPWLDPSWFPPMLEGQSFGVFSFTFRGCEGGCGSRDFEGWLLDAKAAVQTAKGLDGVDPEQMANIGASIGADGAPDTCGEGCLGAMSFSPGGYLTIPYDEAVTALDSAGKPAWCLAAEGDPGSAPACQSASGDHYRMEMYPGADHGMQLVKPDMEPNPMELILEFLQLVFALD
jgi:dienelactone hydrolase